MRTLRRNLQKLFGRVKKQDNGSIQIIDPRVHERFFAEPSNTFFVSFPRTGSHWLRMVTELYFGRPSLVRIFYYPERQNYLMFHTHDMELDVERSHVIYLYRNPIDTIFSQLYYYKESLDNQKRIIYWTDFYGRHLDKWLHKEHFTTRKTLLTYEGMKRDFAKEFQKLTGHFEHPFKQKKLDRAIQQVTKDEVKRKTGHDPQVVDLRIAYDARRKQFRQNYEPLIWDVLLQDRQYLSKNFS